MSLSDAQLRAIEDTERASSTLSLLGASFVITSFLWSGRFHTPINRLIFYASWGNVLSNIGTLISRSGILQGADSPLCQFQGFFVQWFIPADTLWAFCMACNVYLTLFHRYDTLKLRKLEWKYCILCYGVPFVPAFVYLFIETEARGKIYGSAILWCWVRVEWETLRIALVYGPIWFMILLTLVIYIAAGREILRSRRRLKTISDQFCSTVEDRYEFSRTTEVPGVDDAHSTPVEGASNLSPECDAELDRIMNPKSRYPSDPINDRSGRALSSSTVPMSNQTNEAEVRDERRRTSFETRTAVWAYTKFALLFFIALLVTWTPSTVYRVYAFFSPPSFALTYVSAFVLPLQGFWNSVIYIATSYSVMKGLYSTLRLYRSRAASAVSWPRSRESRP